MPDQLDIINLQVPDIGRSTEIKLLVWNKQEGEVIDVGEEICELMSDKAHFSLEVPVESTLYKIIMPEDSIVKVGEVIGQLKTIS